MEKQYETVKLTFTSAVLRQLLAKVSNRMLHRSLMRDGEFFSRTGWINLRVDFERMCLVRRGGKV